MAAPDTDWPRLFLEAAGTALSGLIGLLVGIWRWGRQSALREVRVRNDYTQRIEEMKASMAAAEKAYEARLDQLVEQFREAFAGIRRQLDNERLHLVENFVRKDDFREFREEYRTDMRDIKRSISEIATGKK
jgi:hypothetical protein